MAAHAARGETVLSKPTPNADTTSLPIKRPVSFIRTVLGDRPATTALGVCDAHEHVAMGSAWLAENFPEFLLSDLDRVLVDLRAYRAAGGGWIVDSMPTGAGRDAALLAEASQRSGVPVVCPTGVHQSRYYPPGDPLLSMTDDKLAELFVREITGGVDDGAGTLAFRAGVIKVASDGDRLTNAEHDRFKAAAIAQKATGCPILTHTSGGRDAYEQLGCLLAHGANPAQVVLSHCDKNPDDRYHHELLSAGVVLEYDQHFRQLSRGERCVSTELIVELCEEFPTQLLVGMDMARQAYRKGYGGSPGLAWLMTDLLPRLRRSGLTAQQVEHVSVTNALQAFAFRPPT
jgi:predicted metal-dependent phosphotriesterase family hydrolase